MNALPDKGGRDLHKALVEAVQLNDVEAARRLMNEGADPETEVADYSLLGSAIQFDRLAMAHALLDHGAHGDADIVELIVRIHRKLDPDVVSVLDRILEQGVAIDKTRQRHLLRGACQAGWPAIVDCLLKHGFDPTQKDNSGLDAFDFAAGSAVGRNVETLFRSPYINQSLRDTWLCQYIDKLWGDTRVIKTMIQHGGNPNTVNANGLTPAEVARNKGWVEAAQVLEEAAVTAAENALVSLAPPSATRRSSSPEL